MLLLKYKYKYLYLKKSTCTRPNSASRLCSSFYACNVKDISFLFSRYSFSYYQAIIMPVWAVICVSIAFWWKIFLTLFKHILTTKDNIFDLISHYNNRVTKAMKMRVVGNLHFSTNSGNSTFQNKYESSFWIIKCEMFHNILNNFHPEYVDWVRSK